MQVQQEQYRNLLTQTAEYTADYIGAAGEMPAFPNGKALLALQEFIEALSPNGMEASLRTHTATGSITPLQAEARLPGLSSTWTLERQLGQWLRWSLPAPPGTTNLPHTLQVKGSGHGCFLK